MPDESSTRRRADPKRNPSGRNGIHRLSNTPEYRSWVEMRRRCEAVPSEGRSSYISRGVSVCDRWQVFLNFLEDMGPRPEGHTLDRIDNQGDYQPGNCRWATPSEQNGNRSCCVNIEFRGETHTIAEWARIVGIAAGTLHARLQRYGWSTEKALTTPVIGPLGRRVGMDR